MGLRDGIPTGKMMALNELNHEIHGSKMGLSITAPDNSVVLCLKQSHLDSLLIAASRGEQR